MVIQFGLNPQIRRDLDLKKRPTVATYLNN